MVEDPRSSFKPFLNSFEICDDTVLVVMKIFQSNRDRRQFRMIRQHVLREPVDYLAVDEFQKILIDIDVAIMSYEHIRIGNHRMRLLKEVFDDRAGYEYDVTLLTSKVRRSSIRRLRLQCLPLNRI